jgi:dethiobiotin synthetase
MNRGIFITGTDTGVGKTIVTRSLARSAVRQGIRIAALKPVESGVIPGKRTDAKQLIAAACRTERTEDVCAFAFRAPVSPHRAAKIEHRAIDPNRIVSFLEKWTKRADLVLAEGAGGLLVPLADNVTYADVIAHSGFSLIVVAPNRLGAINSTLLTIEAARQRNIEIIGVILNGTPESEFGNADAIQSFGLVPILGEFPTALSDDDDSLADLAEAHLELKRIFA